MCQAQTNTAMFSCKVKCLSFIYHTLHFCWPSGLGLVTFLQCYCLNVVRLKFTISSWCFNPCPIDHKWNALNSSHMGQTSWTLQLPCYRVLKTGFVILEVSQKNNKTASVYICHNTARVCQEKWLFTSRNKKSNLISPSPWKNIVASLFWNRISLKTLWKLNKIVHH